eukprot:c14437_g1_i1.p1 GENE.c14437_g1_i1~~c14437_g1_i1.p1  ORF type:complete len:239 (-),score=78.90 c14437_g1_i1:81-797(-)
MSECQLLGGFSWVIQGLLLICCLGSLLIKRNYESPKRKMRVWLMDTSKQALAAGSEHWINLLLAVVFGGSDEGDPCVWYVLSGLMGFLFGTPFAYISIKICTKIAKRFQIKPILETGVYTDDPYGEPRTSWWLAQCSLWLCIILFQRISMALIFSSTTFHRAYGSFGSWLLSPFVNQYARIIAVMIFFPGIVNCCEFWVQDNFLMEHGHGKKKRDEDYDQKIELSNEDTIPILRRVVD